MAGGPTEGLPSLPGEDTDDCSKLRVSGGPPLLGPGVGSSSLRLPPSAVVDGPAVGQAVGRPQVRPAGPGALPGGYHLSFAERLKSP